ncbi:hypothetical protein AK812_SmicGene34313 [Symbiodinium microadriaticum]|uniref:Uncharacterized protein n=1 Tax=Symbiodinium microadriaticum TaxID=2951 RepID=A0A1Q9CPF6_SYMMI|nr:hypothetical protein AK812_SmicGene34313 [Symbiodinium microadriaticum]
MRKGAPLWMNDLIEVPEDLCKARGVAAGKALLPKWILLYTVAPAGGPEAEAEAAEIRTSCKISAVHPVPPDRMQTSMRLEAEAWSEVVPKTRQRSRPQSNSSRSDVFEWVVDKQFTFSQPISVCRLQFPGKQLQMACTASSQIVQECKQSGGLYSGTSNRNAAGPGAGAAAHGGLLVDACFDRPWLIRVPRNLNFLSVSLVVDDANNSFCTPGTVVNALHVQVEESPRVVAVQACRLRHAIVLENGPDYEDTYRAQVKGDPAELQALAALLDVEGGEAEANVENLVQGTSKGLLWYSFRHLGMMLIMFNALQESCKASPRWDSFEKQLAAISKLLRDRSFKDIVVHRMMATATAQEKSTVLEYHGELLSWRWESLYESLKHYVHVRPILQTYWDRELLSSEAQLCDAVGEALTDPFYLAYAEWAFMFSGFVQRWARWMEGCFCHERELKEAKTRQAREAISCCWKGKRTAVLAAGYAEDILAAARACTSPRYTEAVLRLPREVAAAMAFMDQQAREKWATVFQSKTVYFQQLPFRLAGAFAHHCMPQKFTLEGSKQIVAECFQEYDRLCAVGRVDALLHGIFQRTPAAVGGVADQLWGFSKSSKEKTLEHYPLAWAEVQERAFCSCVERATEKQHVLIKIGARRTLRYSGPAMACIRARRRQLEAFMDDAAGRSFLHENWRHKSPDVDLLSHVLPRAKCFEKTFAYRLSRVYGYNEADHFMDTGEIETSAAALGHATDKALKTAAAALGSGGVKLSTHGLMIVGFLKSQLQTGCVFSVPEAIFATLQNKCEPDEGPEEETAGNFTLEDIAGL